MALVLSHAAKFYGNGSMAIVLPGQWEIALAGLYYPHMHVRVTTHSNVHTTLWSATNVFVKKSDGY